MRNLAAGNYLLAIGAYDLGMDEAILRENRDNFYPIRCDIEYLVDEIAEELLARSDSSSGPAARLAHNARTMVVPWAEAS